MTVCFEEDIGLDLIVDNVLLPCDRDRVGGETHEPVGGLHPVA